MLLKSMIFLQRHGKNYRTYLQNESLHFMHRTTLTFLVLVVWNKKLRKVSLTLWNVMILQRVSKSFNLNCLEKLWYHRQDLLIIYGKTFILSNDCMYKEIQQIVKVQQFTGNPTPIGTHWKSYSNKNSLKILPQ